MNPDGDLLILDRSPSGSVALRACSTSLPPSPSYWRAASAQEPITLFTVTVSALESLSEPSLADTVADAVPESENPGARWILPVVGLVVVTVRYAGPDTLANVKASPSGSEPAMV